MTGILYPNIGGSLDIPFVSKAHLLEAHRASQLVLVDETRNDLIEGDVVLSVILRGGVQLKVLTRFAGDVWWENQCGKSYMALMVIDDCVHVMQNLPLVSGVLPWVGREGGYNYNEHHPISVI